MGLNNKWEDAVRELKGPFLISNESIMVSISGAEEFVDWVSKRGKVLGFEGFYYNGKDLIPEIDAIADFSDTELSSTPGANKALLRQESFQRVNFIEFTIAWQDI